MLLYQSLKAVEQLINFYKLINKQPLSRYCLNTIQMTSLKRKGDEEHPPTLAKVPKSGTPSKKMGMFDDPDTLKNIHYYFEKGLRKVPPYYFTFKTYCKGRWLGMKLFEVFEKEFTYYTPEYYKSRIDKGMVTVNGSVASADYVLCNNDFIQTVTHRHETPISDQPIEIIQTTDDIVVINKPSSIPVHPAGKYRCNTIAYIMAKELNIKVYGIHRLDRLTSGMMIFGRNSQTASKLSNQIKSRNVHKIYIARVKGEFPSGPIECCEPICVVSHKFSICRVGYDGKESKTFFERLSYNGKTSLVQCKPLTGRMHQIRVHLQHLGYPVLNDPLYGIPLWGSELGKGGIKTPDNEIIKTFGKHYEDLQCNQNTSKELLYDKKSTENCTSEQCTPECHEKDRDNLTGPLSGSVFDESCPDCLNPKLDPTQEQLILYLHALSYSGPDWKYETPMPEWGSNQWKEPTWLKL